MSYSWPLAIDNELNPAVRTATPPAASLLPLKRLSPTWTGSLLVLLAAIGYTLSNMAFRDVATRSDLGWVMWATAIKAVPVTLMAWMLVGLRRSQGLPSLPTREHWLPLIAAGLATQVAGNVMFQMALGIVGLAFTVALTFAGIIVGGAVLGRMLLGEPITPRSVISMALLLAAVAILQVDAAESARAVAGNVSTPRIVLGGLAALASGVGFAFCGVIIRRALRAEMSHSATVVVICTMGVVLCGPTGAALLGPRGIQGISWSTHATMLVGGVLNALAFFAVSAGFKRLSVVRVNLINSSQVALAALAGIVFFNEALTVWTAAGITLTMCGLTVLGLEKPAMTGVAQAADLPAEA
jgi:drug/metabolite transporter (DMT)-like permease